MIEQEVCAMQVLRPSGMVVSMRSVEKIIKKDMLDPFTEPPTTLREKDIIPLRVEGTCLSRKPQSCNHAQIALLLPSYDPFPLSLSSTLPSGYCVAGTGFAAKTDEKNLKVSVSNTVSRF